MTTGIVPIRCLALCLCPVAALFGQAPGTAQSVEAQSEGLVPQVFQPGPRVAQRAGPFAPAPEAIVQPKSNTRVVPQFDDRALYDGTKAGQGNYPAVLSPKDFFGRVYNPAADYYDPYDSSLKYDGRPRGPGETPAVPEQVLALEVKPYSFPEIAVAEETWVTLVLMRDGEIVLPQRLLAGSEDILQVRPSSLAESPYVYLRAAPGRTESNGNFLRTTLDVEVRGADAKVYNYKFKVKVVPQNDKSFAPTVKVDLVNPALPAVFGGAGSRFAPEAADDTRSVPFTSGPTNRETLGSGAPAKRDFAGSNRYTVRQAFTRDEVRRYFPIMVGMAKAFADATAAGAPGYGRDQILPFAPSTAVAGRKVDRSTVPAFRNPADNQVYFLSQGFFFPKYDAILYALTFRNRSRETLWFNYAYLGLVPGFEPSSQSISPTVVSPEFGETTPPGAVNTLWILVQGRGWQPETPVRLAFPPAGMDSTLPRVVQPHLATPAAAPPSGLSLQRADPDWSLSDVATELSVAPVKNSAP